MIDTKKRRAVVLITIGFLVVLGLAFAFSTAADDADPYTVTNGATFDADNGATIIVGEDLENVTSQHPFREEQAVDLHPYGHFSATGDATARVTGFESEWTTLDQMNLSDETLTADVDGKQQIEVATAGGESDSFQRIEYRGMGIDDGTTDFSVAGDGQGEVTVHGLPDNKIVTVRTPSGTVADYETVSGGTATFTVSLNSSSSDDDEYQLASTNNPSFDDASATPTGEISTMPDEFAIDVDHPDFPEISADVEFTVNGEPAGTKTISETGSVSVSPDDITVEGGENQWSATVTDEYGNTVQSETHTFLLPTSLNISDEITGDRIDDRSVNLTLYYQNSDTIVTEEVSNGELDMTGLPVNEPVVVAAEADSYHPRRIYLSSVTEEGEILLLPESEDFVDIQFTLDDYTGAFPDRDTILRVERSIDGEWKTVLGDHFGATGEFTAQLQYNTRHRLTVINTRTGEERQLGTITPTADQLYTLEIRPGDIEISEDEAPLVEVSPTTRTLQAIEDASVSVTVDDRGTEINQWHVTVTHDGDTLIDETHQGPTGGSTAPSFDLSERTNGTVTVTVEVETANGMTVTETVEYRISEHFEHDNSLWDSLDNWGGELGGATTFVSVLSSLLITGIAATRLRIGGESVAGVALISIFGFSVIGWVPMSLLFACVVTYAAVFGLRRGL